MDPAGTWERDRPTHVRARAQLAGGVRALIRTLQQNVFRTQSSDTRSWRSSNVQVMRKLQVEEQWHALLGVPLSE